MRHKLEKTRNGITHHFTILTRKDAEDSESEVIEMDGYITANVDASGRLGEFFVRLGKIGSWGAAIDGWAVAMSLCLQHGVPVKKLFGKFERWKFWPAGGTRNVDLPRCDSIYDYIAKWILKNFTGVTNWEESLPITVVDSTEETTKP